MDDGIIMHRGPHGVAVDVSQGSYDIPFCC